MARAQNGRRTSKLTGKLADFSAAAASKTLVIGKVEKHLIQKINDRDQTHIHPSEMAKADWCPRQTVYRISGQRPERVDKKFSMQLENIFAEGHAIHAKWQTWLWETGDLWGNWECSFCDNKWTAKAPMVCPSCGRHAGIKYKEVPLDAKDKFLISGHADGAIWDDDALIEIKSVGIGTLRFEAPKILLDHTHKIGTRNVVDLEGIWKDIKRPFPAHLRQGNLYLALAKELGLPFDKMIFIYESKAHQAYKEMTVKYSARIAEPLLDLALDVKYAVENHTNVSRPVFATGPDAPVCKSCPFRKHCWEGSILDDDGPEEGTEVDRSQASISSIEVSDSREAGIREAGSTDRHYRARRPGLDGAVRRADSVE